MQAQASRITSNKRTNTKVERLSRLVQQRRRNKQNAIISNIDSDFK
jgi:hypothetical protein